MTMRCYGEYIDDRICDMCRVAFKCRMERNEELIRFKTLNEIRENCKYYVMDFNEYTPLNICKKKECEGSRYCVCDVTLECDKYGKEVE